MPTGLRRTQRDESRYFSSAISIPLRVAGRLVLAALDRVTRSRPLPLSGRIGLSKGIGAYFGVSNFTSRSSSSPIMPMPDTYHL